MTRLMLCAFNGDVLHLIGYAYVDDDETPLLIVHVWRP